MTATRYWRTLKTTDFANLDREGTVVILPLAAIEQHGPHLPLDVDLRINEGVMSAVADAAPNDLPFLILPTQAVGYSAEHEAFPGTLSQSPAALIESWTSLVGQAAALGFRRFLLFNSHGGSSDLMRVAARELRVSYDVLARTGTMGMWKWGLHNSPKGPEHDGFRGMSPYVEWIWSINGAGHNTLEIAPNRWGSPASRLADLIRTGHPDREGKKRVEVTDADHRVEEAHGVSFEGGISLPWESSS